MAERGAHRDSNPLVEKVLERIAGSVDPSRVGVVSDFARSYLRRLSPDTTASADALLHEVLGLFRFVEARPEAVAVRAFNPGADPDGYEAPGTVIEVNVEDMPFLVDSVTNEVEAHGLSVVRVLHPVIGTVRDEEGRLVEVRPARQALTRESVQHYVLDRALFEGDLPGLERAVSRVIDDVRMAVRDFRPMLDRVSRMIDLTRSGYGHYPDAEVDEAIAFLEWLRQDNFVFLGYREYRLFESKAGTKAVQVVADSGLGILSTSSESRIAEPTPLSDLPPDLASRYEKGDLLVITKSNRYSTVHRRAKMDYIGVRIVDPAGDTAGEARLLGLFTSKAYMEPASRIPVLRRKLRQILTAEDLIEGSHDHKAVVQLFEGFPKDELFSAPTEALRDSIMGLLALQERQQVRLFIRRDLLERSVSVLVALPRDRFNAALRKQLQDLILRRFEGRSIDYHLDLGGADPARIHFTVWVDAEVPEVSYEDLAAEVRELTRSWEDRLFGVLAAVHGPARARRLADRWAGRFPDYYPGATELGVAAGDVARLEELVESGRPFVVGLQNETEQGEESLTRVALYRVGGKRPLSELVPALEDMGLQVVEESPTRILGDDDLFIHDFGVLTREGSLLDLDGCAQRVVDALAAVWGGEAESDSLDRLVVDAGLDRHQVEVLRAYRTYWRRVSPAFTVAYVNDTLVDHPAITSRLVRLFRLRFDPDGDGAGYEDLKVEVLAMLELVPSLDQDRILRGFLRLVEATVRTNAYRPDRGALVFKLRSSDVPDMPRPHPFREIFVLGREVEGIHLRGGPVARGGIRWSDRREDYRTETLGLMKAQMTKNAVIVPTGAKGGFVLRRPVSDPKLVPQAVRSAYEVFIRGLLDVTDNRVDDGVVHPPGVRAHDGEDPYLVVAADRGTATFSDVANAIARERGFWLDDAFASGGTTGYDHKALGITARGAWKSLERHFAEIGLDPYHDVFTVVGIGDMSGDVFGNGMLGSDRIALVAAFDHRHVFLDPNPDPETAFRERRRLFDLPGSSWADYDRALISPGGGVHPRTAKRIDLSPEVQAALGTEAAALTPSELIRVALAAPVDLLWNGGIGTYVKAAAESNEEVGDRANDGVRVDAGSLRCRVVVEGGNLGFTQRGRIEYALAGGRINTDFIDNSGGVDCSDREVNLKVLLGQAQRREGLDPGERNALIAAVADEVVERILDDNFRQVQIISQEEMTSGPRIDAYEQLMAALESEGMLDRQIESLPHGDELADRVRRGGGLTRPELAVLVAYAKRSVTEALLRSGLPDSSYLVADLHAYFPATVSERFGHLLLDHPLRRELIATLVANDLVDSVGSTFVSRLVARTGAEPADVVEAYRVARDVSGSVERRQRVEDLFGSLEIETWTELMEGADWLVATLTRWYLGRVPSVRLDRDDILGWREDFALLAEAVPRLGSPGWAAEREQRRDDLVEAGVPEDVAVGHAFLDTLVHGPDVVDLARSTGRDVLDVGRVFLLLGRAVKLDRLERILRRIDVSSAWQRWAVQTLEDDLVAVRRLLSERVLEEGEGMAPDDAVDHFLAARPHRVARLVRFTQGLDAEKLEDLAPLMVAVRQVRALAG